MYELYKKKIKEIADGLFKTARSISETHENFAAVCFFIQGPIKTPKVVGTILPMSDTNKDEIAEGIKEKARETKALAVFMITEAYMIKSEAEELEKYTSGQVRVSEHPDKQEILHGILDTKFSSSTYIAEINRVGDKKVLKDTDITDNVTGTGRFSGFLEEDCDETVSN